jgi:murein DD-endopeptidase MepM/ murein hydrolase activator NlpD
MRIMGVITKAQYWTYSDESFGNNVSISYGDPAAGCEISLGHLENFVVKEGQEVKKGELLGYIGDSGLRGKIPSHLHIEAFCLHPSPAGYIDLANLIPSLKGV